ncbi:MAG TPA: tRNA lysidine(34) synthetase TilS [Cytophagaceae bacterium]|nr:tRNA lysidine(34) synthetase TilS [Cytophagaceae bacterium]
MLDRFHKYNTENNLFRPEDKLLVAVSGGVDSVVLCHLLNQYKANFTIAHCNFGLREQESEEDEQFVETLAEDLQANIHLKKFDTKRYAKTSGTSIQMAARALRYEWFADLCAQKGYTHLLTAHHQNDLLETVLLNLVRGTGIAGLHGIKPKAGNLIRPLLFATKEEILEYAQAQKLSWREDSSNESTKYHRNLLRLEIIPLLKKINPNLEQTIRLSVEKISAAETVFQHYIHGCRNDFILEQDDHHTLDYAFLADEPEPLILLFELLKPYGFNYTQCKEILECLSSEAGKKFISPSHLLVKDRGSLIITTLSEDPIQEEIMIDEHTSEVVLPWCEQTLHFSITEGFEKSSSPSFAYLNYEKLKFPLKARPWQAGDSFQPLGMKGRKKVSDFLNDLKIPLNLKDKTTVILSGKEIIWIAGYRIDEHYKAEEDKKSLLISIA